MVSLETRAVLRNPETLLNSWLSEVKARWQDIPEFETGSEKLRHLAIICDGNRRAAKERGLNPFFGHRVGVEVVRGIARACREWQIPTLTFWTWSTENWKREAEQTDYVMGLGERFLPESELLQEFLENGVKFTHLGRKDRISNRLRQVLENLEEQTASCDQYRLNLAMDYGGLDEIVRAIDKMFRAFQDGSFGLETIKENPQMVLGFLDTATQVLPDLVIRTGVKESEIPHTSGFMPLQTVYSGWFFSPDLFPDLTPQVLLKPITEFIDYERRFGR